VQFISCELPGLILIEHDVFKDSRGYFLESYNKKLFHQNGLDVEFVQDNISFSGKGTLRGLHYQLAPHAQGKLVRVTMGQVYDVAVDIRRGSPTFGKWMGIELSAENHRALFIPPGFAHGFYVQSELAQFVYKCTNFYVREADRGILWSDPQIGINWPERGALILSDKDRQHPPLREAEINLVYP
jgi:dTDP-4-dehydrorhamnose 3,5-epimerase